MEKPKSKKRNMQDATLINIRALKKRVDTLEVVFRYLLKALVELNPTQHTVLLDIAKRRAKK